jgi:hypothetical protein
MIGLFGWCSLGQQSRQGLAENRANDHRCFCWSSEPYWLGGRSEAATSRPRVAARSRISCLALARLTRWLGPGARISRRDREDVSDVGLARTFRSLCSEQREVLLVIAQQPGGTRNRGACAQELLDLQFKPGESRRCSQPQLAGVGSERLLGNVPPSPMIISVLAKHIQSPFRPRNWGFRTLHEHG